MSNIKLLYITNSINHPGGLERVLSIKASYLVDHFGYEVHILSLNEPQEDSFYSFSPLIHFHSIEVDGNPLNYIIAYVKGFKRTIKQVRPDVISICDDGLKAFFLPLLLGKKTPLIYERHVSKEIEMNANFNMLKVLWTNLKWKLMSQLAKTFSKFVVLTKGNTNEWSTLRNIGVIPNPTSFYPEQKASLDYKLVLAVGKQSYQKGYDRLLDAWQMVESKYPEWHLDICGKIDLSYKLPEQCNALSINNVRFYKPIKNIKEKYLNASICVLSSRYEGFGMVLIEAMSCGVPCVAFDCPHGPADIITDGEDGFVVPNGDIDAFAQAIQKLIGDDDLRKEMGAKARENVKRYLPDNIIKDWDTLFKTLVSK
jgi:glycosyltransferase involved in cell wall biosynthesis